MEPAELAATGGDRLLGVQVAERYMVVRRLGAGAMGTVYYAWQEPVGRAVALKLVRPERHGHDVAVRFEREARATSVLRSPHTVVVHDFGDAGDAGLYLVMELLEGETLGQRLKAGPMPVATALQFAAHALASLAEAHANRIIHRDLKPDNLFITRSPDGQGEVVKVLDFGIAKILRDDVPSDGLETQAGTVFGTPRYMSPEQAQGRPLDARSDLYSLGVILFQMLTGRAPFDDRDAVVVMARHIKEVPPPPSTLMSDTVIPREVDAVVARMLAKNPAARPESADVLRRDLDALHRDAVRTGDVGAWTRGASAPVKERRGVHRGLAPALALGFGLAVAVVLLLAQGFGAFSSRTGRTSGEGAVAPPAEDSVEPAATAPAPAPLAGADLVASAAEPAPAAPASADAEAADRAAPSASAAVRASDTPAARPGSTSRGGGARPAPAASKPRYGRFD